MKKSFIYALSGAIAFIGTASFTACSSSDEIVNNPDYNPETNAVKTEFTIALPENVNAATRQSATIVQEADNSFRGMQNIILVPFATKPTAATDVAQKEPISLGSISTSDLTNLSSTNSHYKVYTDIDVPLGTTAFLFYGKATPQTGDFVNGKTTMTTPATASAGYGFTPGVIHSDTGTPTKGASIVAYLNLIAGASGWSTTTNAGLSALYENFKSMTAGCSAAVQRAVQDLYQSVRTNTDDVSQAIEAAILTNTYATANASDASKLDFAEAISGFPADINLPDGAAAIAWNSTAATPAFEFAGRGTSGINVNSLNNYIYPAELWYRANTLIGTSNSKQATATGNKYPSERTSWTETANTGILNLYDGTAVTSTTRSIVLKDEIQYAVGRFAFTIQCATATGSQNLYDHNGDAVTVKSEGFPVTGVIIGNQRAVDFQFAPTGTTIYNIYDKEISGMAAKAGSAEGKNSTLVYETPSATENDVNIAVELTNNTGQDFYGYNNCLIPDGGKFYMVGTLHQSEATETSGQVFKQDYVTTANFTIKLGTAGSTNDEGLGAAHNVIPDLRTPKLELGLSVDLHWIPGHTYNINI